MDIDNGQIKNTNTYNDFFDSVLKKTEKLTTALYMITDYMDDKEPLKNHLRLLAVELLSSAHDFVSVSPFDHEIILKDIYADSTRITSLVSLGKTVDVISKMNGEIILREFNTIIEVLKEYARVENITIKEEQIPFVLPSDFFGNELIPPVQLSLPEYVKQNEMKLSTIMNRENSAQQESKKTFDKNNPLKKTDMLGKFDRKNLIIKLIKDKKEVTIKDIHQVLNDCSEKTIQRELSALVSEGVLKKQGEKRWSKYSLL